MRHPQLHYEAAIYQKVESKSKGIPNIYYYGNEGTHYCLVIDLLGKSLEDVFLDQNRFFSLETICEIGI